MKLTRASDLTPRPISWIWQERIPCTATTLIEGDPGCGKSTLTVAIAAHVSTGCPWPDETPCPQGRVIILSTEDDAQDIITARLTAVNADLHNVSIFTPSDLNDDFIIPDKVSELEEQVKRLNASLVIIDPLVGFLSLKVNANEDHAVRRALTGLKFLAKNWGCSILTVRHLNKRPGIAAIYRGGGSIGIIGDARSAFLVAKNPTDARQSLMLHNKSNYSGLASGLAFELVPIEFQNCLGELVTTSRLEWAGEVNLKADAALNPDFEIGEKSAVDQAIRFLQDQLANGSQKSTELFRSGLAAGITRKQINRAALLLNVVKFQDGKDWLWDIPTVH